MVNNLLSSHFLTRNLDVKAYIIICLYDFYTSVKLCVALLEEHRLKLLENKSAEEKFGSK
jgi:hypothetical protein